MTDYPNHTDVAQKLLDQQTEINRLRAQVACLEDDARKLRALECAGVDNWSGYDYAMELLAEYEREDNL